MKTIGKSPVLPMTPFDVHVWLVNLDSFFEEIPIWERLLSEEEINRSKKYHFPLDRFRFIARRGILRQLLGWYTGLAPAEIKYRANPYGKLSLISDPISFNLSHSEDRIVFAFTSEKHVGVDIEFVRPLSDLSRMVDHWFSPEERATLFALTPTLQLEAFYHTWTQKEAYIKARGEGLALPLEDFSVSIDPNKPGKLLSVGDPSEDALIWKITTCVPEPGWRVAVCVKSTENIKVIWHTPDPVEFVSSITPPPKPSHG